MYLWSPRTRVSALLRAGVPSQSTSWHVSQNVTIAEPREAVCFEHLEKLTEDPLLHELLERRAPGRERGQVVHAESGQHAEQVPGAPEPLVHQALGVLAIALHEDLEHRAADLGVARLV